MNGFVPDGVPCDSQCKSQSLSIIMTHYVCDKSQVVESIDSSQYSRLQVDTIELDVSDTFEFC